MSKLGKFRRLAFVAFLAVALFALVFALAGCDSDDECAHEHTTTTTTATCTEGGTTTITCLDCNTVLSTVEVGALGHDYVTDESRSVAATCTSDGTDVSVCSRCGDVHETATIAKGHSYEEVVTDPTCLEQGYTTYTCSECHDSYVGNYTQATGHTWDNEAACAEKHCVICDAFEPGTESHNYVFTSTTATCEHDGVATYTCTKCHDEYEEAAVATGHTFALNSSGNTRWTESDDEPVLVNSDTCTYEYVHYAYCTTCCQDIYETYESVSHNYVLTTTKTATCVEDGTKEMQCTVCHCALENSQVTYCGEHSYDSGTAGEGCITYTCTVKGCGNTKVTYTSTSAAVTTLTLANDVQLSTGTVISMSEDALKTNAVSSASGLTLSADEATADDLAQTSLSEEDIARVGDSTVYSITLSDGNNYITNFDGTITVKIPYTLSDGEDETYITIFYLNGNSIETINAQYTDGYVVFTTDHFSYYTVGKYTTEELCNKYGHNIKVLEKQASCTEAGYHIEICTRCNKTLVNTTTAAYGHNFTGTVTTEATCTGHGVMTYECSLCGKSYTGVISATGHSWELQDTCVEATCTHAGHNDYTCSSCGATYTVELVQLAHDYVTEVVAATCTAQGYTLYTCSMCGGSYKADYIDATGHSWNTTAACQDRECLVCGAAESATAEHNYVDGVCSVCGYGCDHDYEATVVEPTCTEYGYTTKVCSKCHTTIISDYVEPLGHTYTTDLNKCDVCGSANPEIVSVFNALLENCYSYEYTIALTDASFVVSQEYYEDGQYVKVTCTMEGATIYIAYVNDKIIIYGTGSADYEDVETYNGTTDTYSYTAEATIYGDGEYAYIYTKLAGSDNQEMLVRLSYEYILGDYYDLIFSSEDTMAQYTAMIEEVLGADLYRNLLTVLNNNSTLGNEIAALAFAKLFSGEVTDSGYAFTLNIDLLGKLNENLYTLTVSELLDEYLGEGTLASIKSYLSSIENKTLYQMVTEILVYGEEYGVTKDLAFSAINTIVTAYTEEEFDLETYLTSGDDSIGKMTVSQIILEMTGAESYSQILSMLDEIGEMNIYEQLGQLDSDATKSFYNTITKLANGEVVSIKFITDENYAITSVKLVLHDAVVNSSVYSYSESYNEEEDVYEEQSTLDSSITMTLSGTLSILYSCDFPEDYDALKTNTEGIYSSVVTALMAACEDSKTGTIAIDSNHTVGINKDGTVYLVYTTWQLDDEALEAAIQSEMAELKADMLETGDYTEEELDALFENNYWSYYNRFWSELFEDYYVEISVTVTDISKADNIQIEYDCTGCYWIYFYFDNYSNYVSLYFYIDVTNRTVSSETYHDYQLTDTPEDIIGTIEDAECGGYYYTYYKCSVCGDVEIESHYKWHSTYIRRTLLEGSESCEDGVLVEWVCKYCGEVTSSYTSNSHFMESEAVFTLTCNSDTYNGTTTLYHQYCICGQSSSYWLSNDGYGCEFNEVSTTVYIYLEDGVEKTSEEYVENAIGQIDTYSCIYTGCNNYYTHKWYYCSGNGDDEYTYYQYNSDGTYTHYECTQAIFRHLSTEYQSGNYTDEDNNRVEWSGEFCTECDYGYKYTYKYDSDGNRIYYGYEYTDSNGNVTNSWYYTYNYDSEGNLKSQNYFLNGVFQYTYNRSQESNEYGGYTYTYKYTYSDESSSTNIQTYDEYGREISYYYEDVSSSGEITYWYKWSYTFEDENDPCYALYTESNSYGSFYSYYTYNHVYSEWFSNDNGTCTQPYTYGWHCGVCDSDFDVYERINGHQWYSDKDKGVWVCYNCGLESENPSSSSIYLEDLTYNTTYGSDGYVSIGYYVDYIGVNALISYYLVPVDSQDNLDLSSADYIDLSEYIDNGSLTVIDTGSILRVSLADLLAIAEDLEISLADYDLRVSFNAYHGGDVSSITITDLVVEKVAGKTYTFGSMVCLDYYNNDEEVVDAIFAEQTASIEQSMQTTIVFDADGTATITIVSDSVNDTQTYTYVQKGRELVLTNENGNELYLTASQDASTLTEEGGVLDISNLTEDNLESEWVEYGFVYTLVEE